MRKSPKKIVFDFNEFQISEAGYLELQALAIDAGDAAWDAGPPLVPDQIDLITKYKLRAKHVLRTRQGGICCYCGVDLVKNRDTFDAEHVVPTSLSPQFTFDIFNLAAACKPCNGAKRARWTIWPVLLPETPVLPFCSNHYSIVHPHLDVWTDFMGFDEFDRVIPSISDTGKGAKTIAVCKIHRLNAMRIADHFEDAFDGSVEEQDSWEFFYTAIYSSDDPAEQAEYVEFLSDLSIAFQNPAAIELLRLIDMELL